MNVEILTEKEFERQLKRLSKKYRSIIDDYETLLAELDADPYIGKDLGKGLRKVRMAIGSKGKGKSGGARVITYKLHEENETVVLDLLTIYDKGEISNIKDEYLRYLLDMRDNL